MMVTPIQVCDAIAAVFADTFPGRMLYRDFCPVDFQRPSGFLYVTRSTFSDCNRCTVRWELEASLELFCATDAYDLSSTEALRADMEQLLLAFPSPSLPVGDRFITLSVQGDGAELGSGFLKCSASWVEQRPGYRDPDDRDDPANQTPLMEDFAINGV